MFEDIIYTSLLSLTRLTTYIKHNKKHIRFCYLLFIGVPRGICWFINTAHNLYYLQPAKTIYDLVIPINFSGMIVALGNKAINSPFFNKRTLSTSSRASL